MTVLQRYVQVQIVFLFSCVFGLGIALLVLTALLEIGFYLTDYLLGNSFQNLQGSDFDERSLSLCESTETSERMYGDFFNTVKKGPGKAVVATIEPPPEFQDNPTIKECTNVCLPSIGGSVNDCANILSSYLDVSANMKNILPVYTKHFIPESLYERHQCLNHRIASPKLLHLSPLCANMPSPRNSLSSRLSSSHISLVTQFQTDDSSFITQAISHDTLSPKITDITDMYNVPFDSDIYAVPIDMLYPGKSNLKAKVKKPPRNNKKRGKSTPQNIGGNQFEKTKSKEGSKQKGSRSKRHSLPSTSRKITDSDSEPAPLTLTEVRKYLHTLYSSSSDSEYRNTHIDSMRETNNTFLTNISRHANKRQYTEPKPTSIEPKSGTAVFLTESIEVSKSIETNINHKKSNKNSFGMNTKSNKRKENNVKDKDVNKNDKALKKIAMGQNPKAKMSTMRILTINLKQSFCNLFRWRRQSAETGATGACAVEGRDPPPAVRRALPPLPRSPTAHYTRRAAHDEDTVTDFATSIHKVKDYGWYWGPISVEDAEKVLSNEPDGSFIVRDSSDDHYIFTLTFKLNGLRHVRIEHDQGNFCFGGCTMFKAQTIVEFIENAVETSRSGRYLFFLNLRPLLGPVRVQLLYPVSRFKRVQSLQHMCRFVILKYVRRDLISSLLLPRRLLDYINATHYYSELLPDT